MLHAGNAVGAGLITSLARPGGNVTGTTNLPVGGEHVDLIREFIPQARLIAYASVFIEHYALAADFFDKILKGAKPADLPIQQPARFEVVINLKTVKALGLTIPQSLLLRVDEVIR